VSKKPQSTDKTKAEKPLKGGKVQLEKAQAEKPLKAEKTQTAKFQAEKPQPEKPQDEKPAGISFADKLKFFGLVAAFLVLVGIGLMLLPYIGHLTSDEGRQELVKMIHDAHIWGVLICLGLQCLHVVVAVIPGEAVQFAIGAIYGPLWGSLIVIFGALIASIFVFYVVRKLGAPFVHAMIGKKHEDKMRFLQDSKRLNVIVFILFFIPGLPKDFFTYLVPLTNIHPAHYFVISTLARTPAVVASTFFGKAMMQGNYTSAIIVAIIVGGLGLLGIIFNGKIIDTIDRFEKRLRHDKDKSDKA
jgi:uncharacterized membrane protein YdjX (TVP38/TMEM64 family)